MTAHPLDRPVWAALTSRHAPLAEGGPLAKRFPADILPFAALRDDSPEAGHALMAMLAPGASVVLAEAEAVRLPAGLSPASVAEAVQMVADMPALARFLPAEDGAGLVPLGPSDAAEMLELATLTRPGPFSVKALSVGRFWGVRLEGRLAAMAGERLRQPGFTELSGVCTHPDFRGRGLARTLSLFVAARIAATGDAPYLHAYAGNAAIRLYESIGFRLRCPMRIVTVRAG
ncbi:GNAT family N-acetyltransferase [Ancylobacter sonchi]|uniref:GNAT family N-acetyltransferase n=1 Tax=Ancylobacter sonchi TaxID=1937790 RepID=UPI001BD3F0B3|nr:GNAT family N-acetyltransferase [Ancylobacter sonchi]MBS7533858.1 GNAT family N-acetyltransferase [Ancylobacter sonchi]